MSYPLIGITADATYPDQEPWGEWYAKLPWYALRFTYVEAISAAGGVPVMLPFCMGSVNEYADALDGLVISGGGFDVPPQMYTKDPVHPDVKTKPDRSLFEFAIAEAMLRKNKPVLGICGGMQLLNVYFGGTLHQHLPDAYPQSIDHTQTHPRDVEQHHVILEPETLLRHITSDTSTIPVNSIHHQGIAKLGEGLVISAVAPDGLVEAFEHPDYSFCIGVQWHPEFHVSPADTALFKHFIEAC
jgi:putative glutamine amidotransferase